MNTLKLMMSQEDADKLGIRREVDATALGYQIGVCDGRLVIQDPCLTRSCLELHVTSKSSSKQYRTPTNDDIGKVVEVACSGLGPWFKRVLVATKRGKFICWADTDTIDGAFEELHTSIWDKARIEVGNE